jgi:poly-gamma-glutamate synthesis protein (capsule biosynthesis protein)
MIKKIFVILTVFILVSGWAYFSFLEPIYRSEGRLINRFGFIEDKVAGDMLTRENSSNSVERKLPPNEGKILRLLFFGDLMLDRHVKEKIDKYGLDLLFTKLDADRILVGQDFIGANLESAVTDQGAHLPPDNSYDFAVAPEVLANLKKYNFNFFNLANNHLADQGERGIIETRNNLSALGFYFSGCADGEVGAGSQVVAEKNGLKIGLVGLSMVYKNFELAAAQDMIANLASTTDLVITNIHWGTEYEHQFSQVQQEVAYQLIDAGTDIVIGHHPHVVQGLEIYKGRPIFYCLGNFIFDQYFSPDTQEELAISVVWQPDGTRITLLPMRSVSSQPDLLIGEEKDRFLEKFVKWSKADESIEEQIEKGEIILSF